MTKWNYIFGAITITAIVGGTIYVIKKAKDAEKLEEEAINLDEAREIIERERAHLKSKKSVVEEDTDGEEEKTFEEKIQKVYEPYNTVKVAPISLGEEEPEDDFEMDEGVDEIVNPLREDFGLPPEQPRLYYVEPLDYFPYTEDGIDPKEDKELRYDKDSVEAKHQFLRMELADWEINSENYQIMLQLFEHAFVPTNVGDEYLWTNLIDYRAQFFGITSKWVKEISFADVILHYARSATFNCGEQVPYWVEYFLDFNDFNGAMTSKAMNKLVQRLCHHNYFNEEGQTYGFFGLTRESMDQVIETANMNPDRSVTFEIEFQEFLTTCI